MCRTKGDRLLQMSGANLNEWQRAKLQGMGQHPNTPPPSPTSPQTNPPLPPPPFFFGNLKGGRDAHDCSSLSRQGSVANEGLWVSTRHFTLCASLTTPPCYHIPTPPPPSQSEPIGVLISLSGDLDSTHCWSAAVVLKRKSGQTCQKRLLFIRSPPPPSH